MIQIKRLRSGAVRRPGGQACIVHVKLPRMDYIAVRWLHVGCAVLSIAGFALRGALMLAGSPLLRARFVRVSPHVVDTVLLLSAAWLALESRQYPFVQDWLTAKVVALVAYIGLGMLALRPGRPLALRAFAFAGALACAAYIVLVALARSPLAGFA